ncbi:putative defense protein [Saccostrea echinata]|uniref:putative defense protein n=1 Tax=Saccostrea echinata TaxID=191078 RepID=UPI002A7F1292|nr:putative defense protein [Saccostrea echinata]XP_061185970.1 putative defense protein [Saccostrea echinata]XP_061185971.1 putative defense protein [Saccostrea echinata]
MWSLICLIALTFTPEVTSYPYGPPLGACASMFPKGHGVNAQTSVSPYKILVNATTYKPNDVIEITVNSTGLHDVTYFEGMMVQARRIACDVSDPTKSHGMFSVMERDQFLETMDCENNMKSAVVHMNHSHIENKVFYWKADFSSSVGHLVFRATVVKSTKTFWEKIYSPVIKDETSEEPLTICENGADQVKIQSMFTVIFALMLTMCITL